MTVLAGAPIVGRHLDRLVPADRMLGAGNESRTRDLNLGKVALYQLSYSRSGKTNIIDCDPALSSRGNRLER